MGLDLPGSLLFCAEDLFFSSSSFFFFFCLSIFSPQGRMQDFPPKRGGGGNDDTPLQALAPGSEPMKHSAGDPRYATAQC